MRVQAFHQNDRLYFTAPNGPVVTLELEIADGIRVERAPHSRLLLANGKNAWVGVLTLALRLGWCRICDDDGEPRPGEAKPEGTAP